MPEVDFVMTYPCRFLMTAQGNPDAVVIDGTRCICLFTDKDLVERFYTGKHGDNFVTRTIETWTVDNRVSLLQTLRDWKIQLAPQGCEHVAIDASPEKMAAYVTFAELIDDLENRDD